MNKLYWLGMFYELIIVNEIYFVHNISSDFIFRSLRSRIPFFYLDRLNCALQYCIWTRKAGSKTTVFSAPCHDFVKESLDIDTFSSSSSQSAEYEADVCGDCDAVDSSAVSAAWSGLDTAEVGASGLSRKQPTHSQDPTDGMASALDTENCAWSVLVLLGVSASARSHHMLCYATGSK